MKRKWEAFNMRSFASDNNSGVHPRILEAVEAANTEHARSYGDDDWTARATRQFEHEFGAGIEVLFVWNGTGANVVGLSTALRPYEAVICTDASHIQTDECGASERFLGCKLIDLPKADGKLVPEDIEANIHGLGNIHHVQPRVVSITQSNELGLVYTRKEIQALSDMARRYGLFLHVDGARLANAAARLDCGLRELTRDCGVDLLSFGGTKNGMMFGEAVVIFNRELHGRAAFLRKQAMQLASKMRFVSSQFEALLTDDLWLRNARHANAMASRLESKLRQFPGVEIARPVEANGVFARLERRAINRLLEDYFFYIWNEAENEVRWITSFDTTEADVDGLAASVAEAVLPERAERMS